MTDMEIRELARQEQNKYHREWRAKHPDKVRETNRRYWERRAAKLAAEREAQASTEKENIANV